MSQLHILKNYPLFIQNANFTMHIFSGNLHGHLTSQFLSTMTNMQNKISLFLCRRINFMIAKQLLGLEDNLRWNSQRHNVRLADQRYKQKNMTQTAKKGN